MVANCATQHMLIIAYLYCTKLNKIDLKKNERGLKRSSEILKWRETEKIEKNWKNWEGKTVKPDITYDRDSLRAFY